MRTLNFFYFSLFSIFFLQISLAAPSWRAEVEADTVLPSKDIMAYWIDNYFETNELWVIKDKNELLRELREVGFDSSEDLYFDFTDLISDNISDEVARSNSIILKTSKYLNYFMLVPDFIKAQLPKAALEVIYRNMILNGTALTYDSFYSKEAAINKYGSTIKEDLCFINGKFYLFINPTTWPKLSRSVRTQFIEESLQTGPKNFGLKINIKFKTQEDIAEIAKTFSKKGREQVIARYLQIRLKKNNGRLTTVALNEILPAFVRKNIDTYARCTGANCFNSTMNMMKDRNFETRYTEDHEIASELAKYYWRKESTSDLVPGDVVVFYDQTQNGEKQSYSEQHAVTVIGNLEGSALVIAKNGFSRFSPYVIQSLRMNASLYDEYVAKVYRKKVSCSKAQ